MHPISPAIGILGGTFDPIHHGHLRMAIEIYEKLALDKMYLTPCYEPAHRDHPIATPAQRLAMLKLAIGNETRFIADSREIDRQGTSYTIDTLLAFRQALPHTPLCLCLGIDAFLGFTSWERYEDILNLAHVVVAHRPSFDMPKTGELAELIQARQAPNNQLIHMQLAGFITLLPITALDISASEIRKQIAMGRNPRYLLPDNVCHYIREHKIYET